MSKQAAVRAIAATGLKAAAAALLLALAAGADGARAGQGESRRFAGAPRWGSTDGWSLKPRGRVQYDVGHVERPAGVAADGLGSLDELRRARIGIEGTAPHGLSYVFEVDVAGDVVEIADASLSWKASDHLTLAVGQLNNFQSLEELTGSRFTSFIERAAFTDAFDFERRLGVAATVTRGPLTAQFGLFHDNLLEIDESDGAASLDGRLVLAPRIGDARLHLGVSAHWRDNGDLVARGGTTRYRQRPLLHASDVRFVGTPALAVERETSFGLEAAVIRGPFHAAAEAHFLTADLAGADRTFAGYYVEAGWFLTGETRAYRGARWDRTRVRRALEEGGFGALQLIVRYDGLDLDSGPVRGGRQHGLLAGLIWIPTDHVRLLLDVARLSYVGAAIPAAGGARDYGVDVVGARVQLDF